MASLNKVQLIGNLGSDPEVRYTPNGAAVANFNLATNESYTDKEGARQEKTEWHRVVLWQKLAENAGKHLKKGSMIYLEGKLQTRDWEDNDGNRKWTTEIVGRIVQYLDRKDSDGGGGSSRQGNSPPGPTDDDLPF